MKIAICGGANTGKSSLYYKVQKEYPFINLAHPYTTRDVRAGERMWGHPLNNAKEKEIHPYEYKFIGNEVFFELNSHIFLSVQEFGKKAETELYGYTNLDHQIKDFFIYPPEVIKENKDRFEGFLIVYLNINIKNRLDGKYRDSGRNERDKKSFKNFKGDIELTSYEQIDQFFKIIPDLIKEKSKQKAIELWQKHILQK